MDVYRAGMALPPNFDCVPLKASQKKVLQDLGIAPADDNE